MPVLRATALLPVPVRIAAGLIREVGPLASALRVGGHRMVAPEPFLTVGDELGFEVRTVASVRMPLVTQVTEADGSCVALARRTGSLRMLECRSRVSDTAAGALWLGEVRWTSPGGPLGRAADILLGRRVVLRLLAAYRSALVVRAAELSAASGVVVGAAVVRDGRLLAARRAHPAELAGRWELPGGQVEPGESEVDALARECHEELGVKVSVAERLGPDLPVGDRLLRVYLAGLADGAEPSPLEHAELRWVSAAELADLHWLPADRTLLPELTTLLGAAPGR